MMSDDDNDGQMIFGDLGGLKLPDICLTGEPRKKPHPGNLFRPGSNPGPHATACPTAVDNTTGNIIIVLYVLTFKFFGK